MADGKKYQSNPDSDKNYKKIKRIKVSFREKKLDILDPENYDRAE